MVNIEELKVCSGTSAEAYDEMSLYRNVGDDEGK
jgi:hypothetical protein